MKTKTYSIVHRYGEDDFSLWLLNLRQSEYEKLIENFSAHASDRETVLRSLPMDGKLHFYELIGENAVIRSCEANEEFQEIYGESGISIRGPLKDILYEITTSDMEMVNAMLTYEEASTVNELIALELCNCDDKHRQSVLEAANARMEKAMSRCIIPEDIINYNANADHWMEGNHHMTDERKSQLYDEMIAWICEHISDDEDLFHTLHGQFHMTKEELHDNSIESLDRFFDVSESYEFPEPDDEDDLEL